MYTLPSGAQDHCITGCQSITLSSQAIHGCPSKQCEANRTGDSSAESGEGGPNPASETPHPAHVAEERRE